MIQIETELTGLEFNALHNHAQTQTQTKTKFYKFLNDDLTHYDFKYKLGLNIDTEPFNPSGNCSKGGLYFCEESKCHLYWKNYGHKLAIIEIPDDARVYVEENKFKADKIIINKIINIEDAEDSFWVNILPHYSYVLRFIKVHTEEICKLVVQKNGVALRYLNIETEEICCRAVEQNGYALKYVINQTEEICKLAIQQNCNTLRYVINQTEEMCKFAVQQYGDLLQYVINQTEEICKLAVQSKITFGQQDGNALRHVKHQTEEICELAIQQNSGARYHVQYLINGI